VYCIDGGNLCLTETAGALKHVSKMCTWRLSFSDGEKWVYFSIDCANII